MTAAPRGILNPAAVMLPGRINCSDALAKHQQIKANTTPTTEKAAEIGLV